MKTYPFSGFDYCELCDAWNLPYQIGDDHSENMIYVGGDDFMNSFKKVGPVYDECPDYFDSDRVITEYLKIILHKSYGSDRTSRVLTKVARDLRVFLDKLGDSEYSYQSPMWKGMSKIEDDGTLVQMTILNINHLWD